jgi:hypothetical protein
MRLATALTITVEAPEFHAAAAGAIPEPDHEQITAEAFARLLGYRRTKSICIDDVWIDELPPDAKRVQ